MQRNQYTAIVSLDFGMTLALRNRYVSAYALRSCELKTSTLFVPSVRSSFSQLGLLQKSAAYLIENKQSGPLKQMTSVRYW